jgi:hypothetical protein
MSPAKITRRGGGHSLAGSALSAYERVIADVANSPGRRPRSKCAGARRSNADAAVNIASDCAGKADSAAKAPIRDSSLAH